MPAQRTHHELFMQKTNDYFRHMAEDYAPRPIPFTKSELREWLSIIFEKGSRCRYCKAVLTIRTLRLDHMNPVKRGGSLHLTNLTPCCHLCNTRKGELTAEEFKFLMSGINTMAESAQRYILKKLGARPVFRPMRDKDALPPKPKPAKKPKKKGNQDDATESGAIGLFQEF